MIKASVIIAFYNKIDYLKLVLAGFEKQTLKDFEIIIADDGSSKDIVEEVEKLSSKFSFPVIHLWQEDKGFRKNKILNRAVVSSSSNYLIFVDGDCIPHPEFVKEHFESRKPKLCLTGRRVNLSDKITRSITSYKINDGYLENNFLVLIEDGIFGKSYDVEKGFYLKNKYLRNYLNKKKRGLLGCNLSLFKEELLQINGFDERYEAPSIGEDSDIEFRLNLCGVEAKSLNNIAVQYHLYHKIQNRPQKNLDLFSEVQQSRQFYTPFGIKKLK